MVKLAATFLFTAALAVATVRAQEAGAEAVEDVLSRDVSSSESDLFGRAAAKVMNDLFSREELSEVLGREFEGDLTWRDVTELVEREAIDMAQVEEMTARAAMPQQPPEGADAPHTPAPTSGHQSVFGQVLNFFNRLIHPKNTTTTTTTTTTTSTPGSHQAPPKGEDKPVASAGAAAEGAEEARDFIDASFEELPERSFEDELDLTEREFLGEELDEALEMRDFLDDTAEFDLAERELNVDEDLMEAREVLDQYYDLLEREIDDELMERQLMEDGLMDVFEREFEDDVLEQRGFEEDVYEREVGDEWDDELLRRAFDVLEELEMLD